MRVSSAVITEIEGVGDMKVKDKEPKDIWCDAPEFKTHSECDILRNYKATDLRKKKQTLLVIVRRETLKIPQPKY
jgi:hypothetical protein